MKILNCCQIARKRKSSLTLYQELIITGMLMIVQSLVLVSKIAQFTSYAAGLHINLSWQAVCPFRSANDALLSLDAGRKKVGLNLPVKRAISYLMVNTYDQVDGVAMGSHLGPVLANIITCQFEEKWVLSNNVHSLVYLVPIHWRYLHLVRRQKHSSSSAISTLPE